MGALKKEQVSEYLEKLECSIAEYMRMPASERSASAIRGMLECWNVLDSMKDCTCNSAGFTEKDATEWSAMLKNEDGTTGPHWGVDQTTAVAESMGMTWEKISRPCWWITMNMMYSDYSGVAEKYGVSIAEFYADMARAFLMDKDGPGAKKKLGAYYHGVVEAEK